MREFKESADGKEVVQRVADASCPRRARINSESEITVFMRTQRNAREFYEQTGRKNIIKYECPREIQNMLYMHYN